MRDRLRRNGLEETNVVHTNGRIFPGSPFCFRQLCVFFPPTSCVYKPWVRGASVLKLLSGVLGQIMTALLVYYQPHRPCTQLLKPLPNRASTIDPDFNGPSPPPSQHPTAGKLTPCMTGKGTQLLVGCHGQSCLSFTMPTLALFR